MPVVIAFTNQKGGVSKTTCATNIASIVANRGARVLLVDSDPQCNASITMLGDEVSMFPPEQTIMGIYSSQQQPISRITTSSRIEGLDIIPSSLDLAGSIMEIMGRFNSGQILNSYLSQNAADYDVIFIDCPPDIGVFTLNAFAASNWVVIPMQTEKYAFAGYGQLLEKIAMVQQYGGRVQVMGVIATMYDGRTNSQKGWLRQIEDVAKEKYLGCIHRASMIAEASDANMVVCEINTKDRPYREFLSLAKAICAKAGIELRK